MNPRVSVIVSTYNRPDALELVLQGLLQQTWSAMEILVADDGSTAATRQLVEQTAASARVPVHHVWHEDTGFRLAAIRNRAAARARGDYLIFIDGDCVPLPDFVERHARLAEPGWFGTGNRILLSERATRDILERKLPVQRWGLGKWLGYRLKGDINRLLPLLRLPDMKIRKRYAHKWRGARGCNLAFWKSDYVAVNGFDERYQGWGREDSDLLIRLIRSGVYRKDMRFAAPVIHLWHPEKKSSEAVQNNPLLEEVLHSDAVRARIGLAESGHA